MSSNLPSDHDPLHREALVRPEAAGTHALAAPLPPEEDEGAGLDVRRYLAALLRYKWMLILASILGAAAGFVIARIQDPVFQSASTIWVESSGGERGSGREQGPISTGALFSAQGWVDLLKSNAVMEPVARLQRLYLLPRPPADSVALTAFRVKDTYQPGIYRLVMHPNLPRFVLYRGELEVQRGQPGDSVGNTVGFEWVPSVTVLRPGRTIEFAVMRMRSAAVALSRRMEATVPRTGNSIKITLTGTSPGSTVAQLNAITERFVNLAAELKREKSTELKNILQEQLEASATNLHRAEAELEGFRVSTITLPSEPSSPLAPGLQITRSPVFDAFFAMKVERDQLRRDRVSLERALAERGDSGFSALDLQGIASTRGASELQAALQTMTTKQVELRVMRARYTEEYEPARRLAAEIATLQRQTIPSLVRQLVAQVQQSERDLDGRIEAQSRDMRQIPTRTIEEARLQRDVEIASQLYTTIQARYEETRLAEVSTKADIRILDPASPADAPIKRTALLLLAGGLVGGFGLAAMGALMLDRFDRRVRYPEQVTKEMGLAMLGTIPRAANGSKPPTEDDAAQVVEALRSLRLNLVHAHGTAGPLIVTITSPGSGDGKSFIASNLALAFADAGYRTLLIDGDIRRGALHRIMSANRKPGLLDHLSGQATREEIVQTTNIPSVDFLGCGTRKAGGPELLASAAMSQLLISLRTSYNVILVDSAPLGAGVDPLVLGSLTGSMLLVLRTGVTDRELAEMKLHQVDRLPIRLLGAVLNDVQPSGVYRYYSYLSGYGAHDEEESVAATGIKQIRGWVKPRN